MENSGISLLDLLLSISDTVDIISPELNGHHKRVTYISQAIAKEMGITLEERRDLFLASLLHDCGSMSLKERLDSLEFDMVNPHKHAQIGYQLFKDFKPLERPAVIIMYHHTDWYFEYGTSSGLNSSDNLLENSAENSNYININGEIPVESRILNLADRVDVLIDKKKEVLGQVAGIRKKILEESGRKFMPEVVYAFLKVSEPESFWLDIINIEKFGGNTMRNTEYDIILEEKNMYEAAEIFKRLIDFRSNFTAAHSSGVAAVAEVLGHYVGLKEKDVNVLKIAGYLHDLGKLAVPTEILEKPAQLTKEEVNIMKIHPYYTYKILSRVEGLKEICETAAFHHERLNGKGYPFNMKGEDLSLTARILAVADIFTAITEDRPYRKAMDPEMSLRVMEKMVMNQSIDKNIFLILKEKYYSINSVRMEAQNEEVNVYKKFIQI